MILMKLMMHQDRQTGHLFCLKNSKQEEDMTFVKILLPFIRKIFLKKMSGYYAIIVRQFQTFCLKNIPAAGPPGQTNRVKQHETSRMVHLPIYLICMLPLTYLKPKDQKLQDLNLQLQLPMLPVKSMFHLSLQHGSMNIFHHLSPM